MGIDNPDAIANSLAHYITLTGDPESLNKLYDLYDKVTVKDIIMVADKYFKSSGLTIGTISSDENGGVK
jgi:zinc protease